MTDTDSTALQTPFVDDGLLEQRQQQREVLLSIPLWLAEKVRIIGEAHSGGDSLPIPSPAQRLLIERHARDRVDDLLDELQVGMVAVIDRGVSETIAAYLHSVLDHRPSHGASSWLDELDESLTGDIVINERALGEMIDLLLMADDLADDGFEDVRFD